ncbi:MAG: preprotein translocase subunit SecY [Clostridia bacterium]|jgi:preprotein translocase, SecY subunit|nr:preprotein translocase subunit SecY [Clostridia bacterium]MBO7360208.1 preprotein translocase subunit SecY [Clostridia bacterium]MBP5271115.1 preprotein translocase subunit SecY [Clostridia bacterium]
MFATFRNAWKTAELRSKILFTALIMLIYRLGASIPLPYISNDALTYFNSYARGSILEYMDFLSGGAFGNSTLFALSVSPYITASIVIQLLTVAIPALQALSKDGEEGRKKITAITRYVTVVLAIVTAYGYMKLMENYNMLVSDITWFGKFVLIGCYCAGAAIIMWLAERVNEHGIGNGVSMILFANIISRVPTLANSVGSMVYNKTDGFRWWGIPLAVLSLAITLAMIIFIVWFTESERRIPILYAKRVVGRKMYGGQSSNLPIKLNMSGVMPIIFASTIASIPATIGAFFPNSGFSKFMEKYFNYNTWLYFIIYLALIVVFAYFYIMISFDPVEVSNNIQKNGGSIPGIRSGRPTIQYIKKILNRITLIGAVFLCIVAGLPMLVTIINHLINPASTTFNGIAFGGNSLLIVVGVILEVVRDLEAQLALRSYGKSQTKGIFG